MACRLPQYLAPAAVLDLGKGPQEFSKLLSYVELPESHRFSQSAESPFSLQKEVIQFGGKFATQGAMGGGLRVAPQLSAVKQNSDHRISHWLSTLFPRSRAMLTLVTLLIMNHVMASSPSLALLVFPSLLRIVCLHTNPYLRTCFLEKA